MKHATPSLPLRARIARVALLTVGGMIALSALLLLSLFWLVPYAIGTYAPKWVNEVSGRQLTVGDATFNPFTLRLNVSKLSLKDGERTLAAFDLLNIKGAWSSITNAAWTVDEISLVRPVVQTHTARDGTLDWSRFLDSFPKRESSAASDSIPRLILRNISMTEGAVRLTDERAGSSTEAQRRVEFAPLSFKLDKLSTLPRDRGEYALDATLNDQTRVQWKGRVGGNPVESSGDLSISQLPLAKLSAMTGIALPVPLSGTASLQANYTAAFGTDFFALGMGGGTLTVDQLKATQGSDELTLARASVTPLSLSFARTETHTNTPQTVFAVEPLKLVLNDGTVLARGATKQSISFNSLTTEAPVLLGVAERKIVIPRLKLDSLIAQLNRASNGRVVLPFSTDEAPQPAQKTAPAQLGPSPIWTLELGELETNDAKLSFSDASLAMPQVASGLIDVAVGAKIRLGKQSAFTVDAKRVRLREVSVRDETSVPAWLSIKSVNAAPFSYSSEQNKLDLPRFEIVAAQLDATLAQGGIDLGKKFASAGAKKPADKPLPPSDVAVKGADAFITTLAGITLTDGRITLSDTTLPTPQVHTLQSVRVNVDKFVVSSAQPIVANASATIANGGSLQTKLRFDQQKGAGELEYTLEKVALPAYSAYLNQNTKLKLAKGEAAARGTLVFPPTTGNNETLRVQSAIALRDVDLLDETNNASFAQWAELSTTDAKLSVSPSGLTIALADLLLDQPRGKIVIGEDRSVNLAQIAKAGSAKSAPASSEAKPNESAATAAPAPAPAPLPSDSEPTLKSSIARVQVTGGDIEFADLSLRPQFGTRISDLSGLIVGLSTELASRAEVSLEGKVDQFGLARLTGTVAPARASQYTDLKATFRNLEMAKLTPYSGKFAGRTIESGKLSLDLDYRVEARRLKGENQVIIDNIKLGDRVDSPDATNLPLDLAIALLRDSNGMIDLGIPVQGSLDDPQFSYGSLVWKAIVNVLSKIATAPFRALGALLGGSGEEFEAVIFEPGEARLLPPEREKLAKLATALEKRPALKLSVEPRFDRAADRDALADNILKIEIGKRAGLKPPGPNEPLIISFTDPKVQAALDELAANAGDDATKLRAKFLPPPANAITGLIQSARERVTERGRSGVAEARANYYPELFALLKSKQTVPEFAFEALATLRGQAIQNTLTGVNKFDSARVSVAAPSPAKNVKPGQVPTQLALTVK
ncbi:MAG: DUF748 domain-containing protein [Betaproteobacteria bacterium]|nr:MAG: DUF748 domain-containing protein [Betaproteobacteria bacterium]